MIKNHMGLLLAAVLADNWKKCEKLFSGRSEANPSENIVSHAMANEKIRNFIYQKIFLQPSRAFLCENYAEPKGGEKRKLHPEAEKTC